MKFRKMPVTVDAYQHKGPNPISLDTLEGVMTASPGDWIITGVAGEIYSCKESIFKSTYEAVGD